MSDTNNGTFKTASRSQGSGREKELCCCSMADRETAFLEGFY